MVELIIQFHNMMLQATGVVSGEPTHLNGEVKYIMYMYILYHEE